jgi:acetyl-CoA acetyltransferase
MAPTSVSDKVAIVGVGTTDFGAEYRLKRPDLTAYDLAAEAFCTALGDSGLQRDEVDGLLCARVPTYERLATMIGLPHARLVNCYEGTGRMSGVILQDAVRAVATGAATTVACLYGNNGRSAGARYGGSRNDPRCQATTAIYDEMQGMTSPGAYVATMYRRYQHLYGVPDGALAPLAINSRLNASKNPNAVMREPITREQYMATAFIAEPLRLFDYCLVNDGGVAFIVTTAERARDLAKPPVYVSAIASGSDLSNYYTSQDFFYSTASRVAADLYEQCGVTPTAYRPTITSLPSPCLRSKAWGTANEAKRGNGLTMASGSVSMGSCHSTQVAVIPPKATCRAGHCTSKLFGSYAASPVTVKFPIAPSPSTRVCLRSRPATSLGRTHDRAKNARRGDVGQRAVLRRSPPR